jgi:hypothetical protein
MFGICEKKQKNMLLTKKKFILKQLENIEEEKTDISNETIDEVEKLLKEII